MTPLLVLAVAALSSASPALGPMVSTGAVGGQSKAPAASSEPPGPTSQAAGTLPAPGPAPDPYVGASTSGIAPHRLATRPLGTGSCSGYDPGTPSWLAYEGYNHTLWVAAPPSCVDVFNFSTYGFPDFVTSINVGDNPFAVAVDNLTNEVYVTNSGSDNVTVISDTNDTVVGWVDVGSNPLGVAFDWRSGDLYVANEGSDNVSVISGSTHSAVAAVPVGSGPLGVAADPATGQVFVANRWSDNVTVISDSTNRVVATVPAGSQPFGVALDNDTDTIYVTNLNSSTITVVNASLDSVLTTIPVVVPATELQGLAYDSATGLLWVGAGTFWAVAINTTSQWVQGYSSFDPAGVAYIPDTGDICVTNTDNYSLGCFGWGVPFPTVPLRFNESGLPSGTVWGVGLTLNSGSLNVTNVSMASSSIAVRVSYLVLFPGPTTYTYTIPPVNGYIPNPSNGSIDVGNTSIWVNVTFEPPPGTFPVVFSERGLPAGTVWTVVLNTTAGSSAAFTDAIVEPNGTYNFTVRPITGYTLAPATGTVTVNGSMTSVAVTYVPLISAYPVIFVESGLPMGSTWGVDFDGSQSFTNMTSLTFQTSNGSFGYTALGASGGYAPLIGNGEVVVDGMAIEVTVPYALTPVTLMFEEQGLAGGTQWGVFVNGALHSSVLNYTAVYLTPGFYTWNLASPPAGYWVLNSTSLSGSVQLSSDTTVRVNFTPFYTVTFSETGLPAGTTWNVSLVGSGTGSEYVAAWGAWMSFQVLAGNYTFIAGNVPYYTADPASGWANASWNPTISIVYTRNVVVGTATYPVTFSESGLPAGTNWTVYVDGGPWSTSTSSFVAPLPNGTHGFVVSTHSGFQATPRLASFEVAGGGVNISIVFWPWPVPSTTSLPPPAPGYSSAALGIGIAGGLVAGAVASALAATYTYRRRSRGSK